MQETLNLFASIVRRRFESMLDNKQQLEVVEFLFFVQNDIRLNQLASVTQVEEIWEHIREKEVLTDFLFLIIQDFAFHVDEESWKDVAERLSRAYSIVYESSIETETPIGDETLERMSSKQNLLDHIMLYPWLKAIVLIDMVDIQVCVGMTAEDLKAAADGEAEK